MSKAKYARTKASQLPTAKSATPATPATEHGASQDTGSQHASSPDGISREHRWIGDDLVNMGRRLVARMANWPWWAQVLLLVASTRLLSLIILSTAALHQPGNSPWSQDGKPDYLSFINIWDSVWYERVAENGYPDEIPRDEQGGKAKENTWAFMPVFPFTVKALMVITGMPWALAAALIATAFALAAGLMVYKLFALKGSHAQAMWGTALVFVFPASPIFQVPYAESMNLFFMATALYFIVRGDYVWAIPAVILMSFSRPVGVPFALMLGLYFIYRLIKRQSHVSTSAQLAQLFSLGVLSAACAVAWPLIAWAVTGEASAYTDTETSWRGTTLVPVLPWFSMGTKLFGPLFGWLFPLLVVLLGYLILSSPPARQMGVVLQLWCASYLVYLLLFLHPQTSTFRMLIPLFPLALAGVFLSRSRAYRSLLVLSSIALQVVWTVWLWIWIQLPGGGDYPP